MLQEGDHLLAAVSGGPDSIALLRVLIMLSPEYRLKLTVAHLNHGLRGIEADGDEDFVRRLCAETGIPCVCRKSDIHSLRAGHGGSLEEVAREERYRFLEETANSCGAGKIATGHHCDDQAETVLINLVRGTGLEGLKGIAPVRNGRIIRPLLDVSMSEITNFLEKEGLTYRTDSSNLTPFFLRNRIRNDLLPSLRKDYNPQIVKGLCQTADIMRRDDEYLQEAVRKTLSNWGVVPGGEEITLPLTSVQGLPVALQRRIIKVLTEGSLKVGAAGIAYCHINAVLDLALNPRCVASLDLPRGIRIEKKRGTLLIGRQCERKRGGSRQVCELPTRRFEIVVKVPGMVSLIGPEQTIRFEFIEKPDLSEMKKSPKVAFMDDERIHPPLVLRNVKPGDRMAFLGMGGTKKLKDYFIDQKISRTTRDKIPLLADALGVIWIAGERISERVRVTGLTKKVLKAEMI